MKGARTDPFAKSTSVPMRSIMRIRGSSHHFFLTRM
jgi:hypothetical protein